MKTIHWIALRVVKEIVRDRRTLVFFFLVPILVMSVIYYALSEDETAKLGVITRGLARFYDYPLMQALEEEENIRIVSLQIPDEENNSHALHKFIDEVIRNGEADGILFFDEQLLSDRFAGEEGTLHLYLEGSRPTLSASILSAIASAMDDLSASLPVVIDAECSAQCANSVNNKPMNLEKHYRYGSEDYRLIDYFLPVFPTFFAFFFTFILSTITFQRERIRGTLERMLIAPVSFFEIVAGYMAGFVIFSSLQSGIILTYILALIDFSYSVSQVFDLVIITLLSMLIALVLGLTASFFSANEFQAVQFIPLVILPQIFLSDMIWDISGFPAFFRVLSYFLPLTYANIIARGVMIRDHSLLSHWPQLLILLGFIAFFMLFLSLYAHWQKRV